MRMLNIIILLLALSSCYSNSEKDRYVSIVEEWQGKQIVLPDGMTDFLTGDTIDLSDADFTILTYVDSTGCTGCKMKLPLWNEYHYILDSISDYNIAHLMVIHSRKKRDIASLLERESYEYPVFVDGSDSVNSINKFPKETEFQTVLLDRLNRVVIIGNPTYIPNLIEFYNSILSGGKTFKINDMSEVRISDSFINLGDIHPNETIDKQVRIFNHGTDTVNVRQFVPSCECIEVSSLSRYIMPKDSMDVFLRINTETNIGGFERSLNIYYDGFDYPSIIQIRGEIRN